jgi:cytoskeletal protein CcmA (bactofilin family)
MFNKTKRPENKILEIEIIPDEEKQVVQNKFSVLATQKPSIISEGAVLEGSFIVKGILHLDGEFKGTLKAEKVTIGRAGVFNGKLEADILVVMGDLKGEVKCNELVLNAYSTISAKITYDSIKMQPGSSFSGELICTHF